MHYPICQMNLRYFVCKYTLFRLRRWITLFPVFFFSLRRVHSGTLGGNHYYRYIRRSAFELNFFPPRFLKCFATVDSRNLHMASSLIDGVFTGPEKTFGAPVGGVTVFLRPLFVLHHSSTISRGTRIGFISPDRQNCRPLKVTRRNRGATVYQVLSMRNGHSNDSLHDLRQRSCTCGAKESCQETSR